MKRALGGIMAFGLLGAIASMIGRRSSAEPGTGSPATPAEPPPPPPAGGPDPNLFYPGQEGWGEGYVCTYCGKSFATAGELNHHRADLHFPPGTVTFCPYDDEMFFTSDAVGLNGYKMHMWFYHQVEVK